MMHALKNYPIVFILVLCCLIQTGSLAGKTYRLSSPDKKIVMKIDVKDRVMVSVQYNKKPLILPSPVAMTVMDGMVLGKNPVVIDTQRRTINEKINPVVCEKRKVIQDRCNELTLIFKGGYSLIFRAYDDGTAYRFITKMEDRMKVVSETVAFQFARDDSIYFPFEESFMTHSERQYQFLPISHIKPDQMGSLPALVDVHDGPKVAITEADLEDYPGLYLTGSDDGSPSLFGIFPRYPIEETLKRDRDVLVTKRAEYLALTSGKRAFPWRVLIIAGKDGELIESDMVFRLAKPLQLEDTAWIRPGKVAWDWWNANNIWGVNFESGINTETYKVYLDFASEYGIEYIILDEGWSKPSDLFDINPEIDMEVLFRYAKDKNVGIILWCLWNALEDRLEESLDRFQQWGVKGIKVDFMQRDDQKMVRYYHKIARKAAEHRLLVDFHGSYKPTGLRRAYPNVMTREGVQGLEHNKWGKNITPEHNVTIPFIRMLAGPMDYTPGAMINAQEKNFIPRWNRPMSQGTRVHQLAMYVVYESPLQMLADSPSQYRRESEIMNFLSVVPTVWDETEVLDAQVAEYVILARKHGDDWYVGGMTNWTPRSLEITLSFLDSGEYTAEIYSDGHNASRYASDFQKLSRDVTEKDKIRIEMAPGGGWVARIIKK
jgi:alpha-glucosidase